MGLAAALPREWSAVTGLCGGDADFSGPWLDNAGKRRVRSKLLTLRNEDFVQAAQTGWVARTTGWWPSTCYPAFMSYLIVDLTVAFPYIMSGRNHAELSWGWECVNQWSAGACCCFRRKM